MFRIYWARVKSDETANSKRYKQQLTDLNSLLFKKHAKYPKSQCKVISLHDIRPSIHSANSTCGRYWKVLADLFCLITVYMHSWA